MQRPDALRILDGDGQVSLRDYMLWYRSYRTGCVAGTPCIGDLDQDGDVDADDLVLFRAELGQTCSAGRVIYYYHNDHLGTPQKMTDSSGTVVWTADYLPFGTVGVTVNTIENNLRFTGQYFDAESGLHYNYHRYFDPETGRYLTPDPIGLDGGINLYVYAQNNPINMIDPFGLEMYRPGYNTKPIGQQWAEFSNIISDQLFPKRSPAAIQAAQQIYYKDIAGRLDNAAGLGLLYGKAEKLLVVQPRYFFGHI